MTEPQIRAFFDEVTKTVTYLAWDAAPAIQCNIRAGRLPPADAAGISHLRLPLSLQSGSSPDALD